MKLAEGLLLRADIQKKLASCRPAPEVCVVQEGERPAEDPQAILRQVEAVSGSLQRLVFAINQANLHNTIETGERLPRPSPSATASPATPHSSERRRCLHKPPERYGVKEIRWVTTVDVAQLQGQVDGLAKQIRELNAAIQEAGWKVVLEQ